jgi:hypothetical protein
MTTSSSALILPPSLTVEAQATSYPRVRYRDQWMTWDYYANPLPALHTVCPTCGHFGLIAYANKRFAVDDKNRVSIDEPFRCDYCRHRFGVKDSQMFDA